MTHHPSFSLLLSLSLTFLFSSAYSEPAWRTISTSPDYIGRGEAAFSRCSPTKLCVLGGRGRSPVSILDTQALSYSSGALPPIELHHFQAVHGPDNCAWVVGAWTGPFPAEDNVPDVWIYCADTDEWTTGPQISRPRGGGAAFLWNNAIYLLGGNVGGHNIAANLVPWFDRYDIASATWSQLPDLPHPRDHFHAVVRRGKVYVAGGRDSTENIPVFFDDVESAVDVFDLATNTWSSLPDFPRPRGGTFSALHDGKVFVMGGEGFGRAWSEVDILEGDTFVAAPDMPSSRHGAGAVSCNGVLWVAGGVPVQGGGAPNTATEAYFDGDQPNPCTPPRTEPPTVTATTTETDPATATTTTAPTTTLPTTNASTPATTTTTAAAETGDTTAPSTTTAITGDPEPTDDSSSNATGVGEEGEGNSESSPESSPDNSDSGPVCFTSDNVVQLRDGSTKLMHELRIGDYVKIGHPDRYSPVYFFSHHHRGVTSKAIRISTGIGNVSLELSPSHHLYVNGVLAPAGTVRVGDKLEVSSETHRNTVVTLVENIDATGLHNPHTLHGDIVVGGVVASTFTTAVHPVIARTLLAPFKAAFYVAGPHPVVGYINHAILRTLDRIYWEHSDHQYAAINT